MHALLLAVIVGQSANAGVLLAIRGQITFVGWDGATKKDPKFGDAIQLSDELSTEADGMLKVSFDDAAIVVLAGSSKFSVDKIDQKNFSLKLSYGRVRVTLAKRITARLATDGGAFSFSSGDVVLIKEGLKTQVVVLGGGGEARAGERNTAVSAGSAIDYGGAPFAVSGQKLLALRRSLEIDETPAFAVSQALETDLPGFVGPKSGHIRWFGPAESFAEGLRLTPPFPQSPY